MPSQHPSEHQFFKKKVNWICQANEDNSETRKHLRPLTHPHPTNPPPQFPLNSCYICEVGVSVVKVVKMEAQMLICYKLYIFNPAQYHSSYLTYIIFHAGPISISGILHMFWRHFSICKYVCIAFVSLMMIIVSLTTLINHILANHARQRPRLLQRM